MMGVTPPTSQGVTPSFQHSSQRLPELAAIISRSRACFSAWLIGWTTESVASGAFLGFPMQFNRGASVAMVSEMENNRCRAAKMCACRLYDVKTERSNPLA
ncbi:hypothetical protein Mapa_005707 [Marchantia paleacea]|nr:hypothetical protein Mapa_005707 [Marchantia paleacea]